MKSHISVQEFEWKQPQENQPKKDDACTGNAIQPIAVGGQKTADRPGRSAQRYEEDGKAENKEKSIEEDGPPTPRPAFLQLFGAEAGHRSHKSWHQGQYAGRQKGNHPGQKGRCIG
jgi:hypothetical protein